ncbi:hypothetical protein V1505DRAFT_358129 [Lipomyces doorenjongii]
MVEYAFESTQYSGQEDTLRNDMIASLEVNVLGVIYSINAFLPLLRKCATKKITAISTGLADLDFTLLSGNSTQLTYSSMKAALKKHHNVKEMIKTFQVYESSFNGALTPEEVSKLNMLSSFEMPLIKTELSFLNGATKGGCEFNLFFLFKFLKLDIICIVEILISI